MVAVREAGYVARALQVSHAFHTSIVAPASEALAKILSGMNIRPPSLPIISNVTGEFYPMGPGVEPEMIQLLGKQVASPVQFVKGLKTLYQAGARIFVELGPKRVLYGFVEDVLGEREGVVPLFTNHPRIGEAESVNLALCGLYAAGLGIGQAKIEARTEPAVAVRPAPKAAETAAGARGSRSARLRFRRSRSASLESRSLSVSPGTDRYVELGRLFAEFLERGMSLYSGARPAPGVESTRIFVTGASLGLPGVERVFDDSNVERILRGDQFIDAIPMSLRTAMVEKNITRLVKTGSGEGRFETIENLADVIKLAARAKDLDLCRDFGFPEDRLAALDRMTRLAIGAGIDALRDAGIPLVMRYKTTTKGTKLPDRWMLPEEMRDDTGVLFTSAFPGYDSYEEIITGYYQDRIRRERLEELSNLRASALRRGTAGSGNGRRDRPAHRRTAGGDRRESLPLRPALPVPRALHGALPVRRVHRRARPQHGDQRGLRQRNAGGRDRRRTGSGWAVAVASSSSRRTTSPPTTSWAGSARVSLPPVPPPPTKSSKRQPSRSTVGATA